VLKQVQAAYIARRVDELKAVYPRMARDLEKTLRTSFDGMRKVDFVFGNKEIVPKGNDLTDSRVCPAMLGTWTAR
jgi:hypothetical protein